MVHIYCGDGKGKTTAATGLAIRSVGSGNKVLFVQFLKDGMSSEMGVLNSIDGIECRFYSKQLGFYKSMTEEKKEIARREYQKLLEEAVFETPWYDMIILDEIISTYQYGFVHSQDVLNFIQENGKDKEIILTGRNPARELVELADYVSEIKKIKHPYDQGMMARKGIEY